MAKHHHHVGDHVAHPHGHGKVASVHHNETFYGVHTGGGTSFFPASQVTPAADTDDGPGDDNDDGGSAAASLTDMLMEMRANGDLTRDAIL